MIYIRADVATCHTRTHVSVHACGRAAVRMAVMVIRTDASDARMMVNQTSPETMSCLSNNCGANISKKLTSFKMQQSHLGAAAGRPPARSAPPPTGPPTPTGLVGDY